MQQVCIRSQLHFAQHESAALRLEGLRLRSHAFAISITATVSIRSQLLSWHGNSLHSQSAAPAQHTALHSALKGSVCAALPSLSLSRQQPASAAGCLHGSCLHSHAAASRSSLQAPHTSPKGLRLRCSASLFMARQQPASAAGCLHGSSLHSHAAASRSSQHALHSALKGSVCAAMLSLPRQQPASAAGCLHGSSLHSQAAASRSSLQALHTSPKGLRLRCSASLFEVRQQPASARSCIWRLQRFDAPRLCSLPPLHAADAV